MLSQTGGLTLVHSATMDDLVSHLKALFGDAATVLFGQLAPFGLIMLLLLANAVQNAMIGPDDSLVGGLLAALTLVVSSRLIARSAWLRGGLEGSPRCWFTRDRCSRMIFDAKASALTS
jgi:hypothetical protein